MNRRDFVTKSLVVATTLMASSSAHALGQTKASAGRRFRFAIIGAGLFGSAAARHLSTMSDGVALIGPEEPKDRETHQGAFASHYDSSRLTRIVDPDVIWATLAKRSIGRYREIEQKSGVRFYEEIGYMMVTPGGLGEDWFNLPAMRDIARDLEVDIQDLDDAALRSRYPFLEFSPDSSAVVQQKDAGYFDPRSLVEAQQVIANEQGTTVIRDEVASINRLGRTVTLNLASGESITADRVLVAVGAYANASGLLPQKLDISVRAAMIMTTEVKEQTPANYPATLYAKTDGEEDFWGLLMPPIVYPDGRTRIKTMDGYYGAAPLKGHEQIGDWSRSNGHENHHHVLSRALREVFPSAKALNQTYEPCLITDTASRYPYIDMLDDQVGLVIGGNGKSAKSSDEIGRIAATMLVSGTWKSSVPQSVFAARFE